MLFRKSHQKGEDHNQNVICIDRYIPLPIPFIYSHDMSSILAQAQLQSIKTKTMEEANIFPVLQSHII